jgi:hypothetical protein
MSGYVHKEIKQALDIADEQPEGSIFLIPVRLEPCQVPDRLGTWQWVDLFAPGAYERLLLSLKREQTSGTFEEEPRFSRRQPVPGSRYDSRPPPSKTFRDPVGRITSVIESIVRIVVPLAVVAGLLVAGVEFGPGIVEKFQGPGPVVHEAVGPAPWVIEGQGYRYEIESVARTSFSPRLGESRTSALVINGHVTRIDSRSFSSMSVVVRNQDGTALDSVRDQGQWEEFPTRDQRLPIKMVVYDSDPLASHVTITINDFHVRNGDLTLRNLPIPSS